MTPAPKELPFDAWWDAHQLVASLIPPGSRVLDVGCGWGSIANRAQGSGCTFIGVEPDPARRKVAAEWCVEVYDGVAEGLSDLPLEPGTFDVVVFADVLEHLVDPWTTLRETLRYLKPGGRVVISLPNLANYAVRLKLLFGDFTYQDFGIYDRTHLRFFTRKTFTDLVHGAGLRPLEWRYTPNLTQTRIFTRTLGRIPGLGQAFRRLDRWLTYRFPAFFAVQFIVACELHPS